MRRKTLSWMPRQQHGRPAGPIAGGASRRREDVAPELAAAVPGPTGRILLAVARRRGRPGPGQDHYSAAATFNPRPLAS
jgi:hypothetical protein